jgi:hypothetical protein
MAFIENLKRTIRGVRPSKPRWKMKLSERAGSGDDNTRRLISSKLSLFPRVDNNDYGVDDATWGELLHHKGKHNHGPGGTCPSAMEIHKDFFSVPLEKTKATVQTEFEEPFPIAEINFFAAYLLCV